MTCRVAFLGPLRLGGDLWTWFPYSLETCQLCAESCAFWCYLTLGWSYSPLPTALQHSKLELLLTRLRFSTSQGMTGSGSSLKKSLRALVNACTLSMVDTDRIPKLPWGWRDRVGGFGKSNCLVYLLFDHLHITVSPTYPVEAVSCDEIGPEIKWKSL